MMNAHGQICYSLCAIFAALALQTGCSATDKESRAMEISKLVQTINDNPDFLHGNRTPSVEALIARGLEAMPPVIELMLSDDKETRIRARTVIENISLRMYGWSPGRGFSDPNAEEREKRFWKDMGSLDEDAPQQDRMESVMRWRQWCAALKPRPVGTTDHR